MHALKKPMWQAAWAAKKQRDQWAAVRCSPDNVAEVQADRAPDVGGLEKLGTNTAGSPAVALT